MKKLADKEYWDSIYKKKVVQKSATNSKLFIFKNFLKKISRDYTNSFIWEYLLPKFLTIDNSKKIIEIGCAPGKYLIEFNKKFGYEPFGVEYSKEGVDIARSNFTEYGINPSNVIEVDFFDTQFHKENASQYDVVFSRGFIEHFDDPKKVVDMHLSLLKKGGLLVILIPNLNGINKFLAKFLNIDSYKLHNTSIMNAAGFSKLFDNSLVKTEYCGPVGFFSWGLFNTNSRPKYIFYRTMLLVQRFFDFLWRSVFSYKHFYSWYSSPYLLYVGVKK